MVPIRETTIYADFETTLTVPVQVWSAASIIGGTENVPANVAVQRSLSSFMQYIFSLPRNRIKIYFHNLKFDGSFILNWLLKNPRFSPLYSRDADGMVTGLDKDTRDRDMPPYSFTYNISTKGQWYSIIIKLKYKIITIWDSLKVLPMSLKALGKSFKTPHQKLDMDYDGHTPTSKITAEEMAYIKNDVLVLKECMEIMQAKDITSMTIGGACLQEFQSGYKDDDLSTLFPDLTQIEIPDYTGEGDLAKNTGRTADSFIRRSYHGGFCYTNPKYRGKTIATNPKAQHDILATSISHVDANSHYPSMMHSKSGNYYPVGLPLYVTAEQFKEIENLSTDKCYYFVRIIGSFKKKPNCLPTLQIKDDPRFFKERNEWLEDTRGYSVDIVLTCQDYRKLKENYDTEIQIIEALAFKTQIGLFDKYIDYWYKIKETSKGALRQIAKLFLNNLYGKFAASTDSSYKIAEIGASGQLVYTNVMDRRKTPGYIAIGSAITSYARNRTISLAEEYYDYYVYSDTDSNVYLLPEEALDKIPKHPTAICFWGVESESDTAIFSRQKTYIEHVVKNDSELVEPYWNVKCCGMGNDTKRKVKTALDMGMSLSEFKPGFKSYGTLKARSVDGGTLLVDAGYIMRA